MAGRGAMPVPVMDGVVTCAGNKSRPTAWRVSVCTFTGSGTNGTPVAVMLGVCIDVGKANVVVGGGGLADTAAGAGGASALGLLPATALPVAATASQGHAATMATQ